MIERKSVNSFKKTRFSLRESVSEKRGRLTQWPCKLSLAPEIAPYFDGADLLIAADCTAYAYGNFHNDFMKSCVTLIGCPRFDTGDYCEKLAKIISENDIKSVKLLKMEALCCSALENAVKDAILKSGKRVPLELITLSTDGRILK